MEQVGRRSWMDPSSAKAAPAAAPEPKPKPKPKPAPSMAEMAEKRAAAEEQKTEQLEKGSQLFKANAVKVRTRECRKGVKVRRNRVTCLLSRRRRSDASSSGL
eukprot:COSAG04_NODE_10213_length_796_cov_0.721664_1_plen_103_part_00